MLQVGRTPGPLLITGSIGGFSANVEINLAPSLPTALVLEPDATSLEANGVARADLKIPPVVDSLRGHVSEGARIGMKACCEQKRNSKTVLVDCPDRPALRVSPLLELGDAASITTTVVTERVDAEDWGEDGARGYWIVAQALKDGDGFSTAIACASSGADGVRGEARFSITPLPVADTDEEAP